MTKIVVILCVIFSLQLAKARYVKELTEDQKIRLQNWKEGDVQNLWELSGQVEGDMVLLPGQRNGLISVSFRWPNNEIPYEIDRETSDFTDLHVQWIEESLKEYTAKTCLTVRPRTNQDSSYVWVTGLSSGCWSYVGRLGGMQQLNLQLGDPGVGCFRNGTIVHEFLHAAGFYHQQSATERDDYVDIIWENIQPGTESNFNIYPDTVITSFGQPYDYDSVMHYSELAFTVNGERTIIPKDPNAQIGQRTQMSVIDANKVNIMYNC